MADKTYFVSALRQVIQDSNAAWFRVLETAAIPENMGWVQADFDGICAGTDISSADLFAALAAIATVQVSFTDEQAAISKLLR